MTSRVFAAVFGTGLILIGGWAVFNRPSGAQPKTTPASNLPLDARAAVTKVAKNATAEMAQSCNQFALDLYRVPSAKPVKEPANRIVAPYSIAESLAMMHVGARGATATEIAKALHLNGSAQHVAPVFATLGVGSGGHLVDVPIAGRYRFGVRLRDAKDGGAEIVEVKADSPAQEAGLKPQDVIVRLGDTEVRSVTDYANALDTFPDIIHGEVRSAKTTRSFSAHLRGPVSSKRIRPLIANALWGRKGLDFLPEFQQTVGAYFGAVAETVDFEKDASKSLARINQWVAERTEDNIKNLLPAGAITPDTALVLTNAVFFEADWAQPFNAKATSIGDFFGAKTTKVHLMHKLDKLRYGKGDHFQVVEIPYQGDYAMTLFLPKERDGLAKFEKNDFTLTNITEWLKLLREKRVQLTLPRFKFAAEADLKSSLTALGVTTAFSKKADFSGMTQQIGIGLSSVVHKAEIEVNEKGTRASAASGTVLNVLAAPDAEFKADHPFLFLIRDTRSGTILFMGRVVAPTPAT